MSKSVPALHVVTVTSSPVPTKLYHTPDPALKSVVHVPNPASAVPKAFVPETVCPQTTGIASAQKSFAGGAQEIDSAGDRYLILNNGTRYLGQPGELNYQSIQFKSYGMKIEEVGGEEISIDHESMSSRALWEDGSLEARALLQWRISLPLILPVMTLLAVSISRVNPRQGRFAHLFPAMLVYVASIPGGWLADKVFGQKKAY